MEKDLNIILWLFGVLITGLYLIIGAGIGITIIIVQRVSRLEAVWSMMNKQAAEILHSPHTPEFDVLLEKLVKTYEDRHYELSLEEWSELQKMSQAVKEDLTEAKGTRLLAAMVYAQSTHKLLCGTNES